VDFEGGHSATWDNRIARADLLIWIDRSPVLRFWRVFLRTLTQRGSTRPDLPGGLPRAAKEPSSAFQLHVDYPQIGACQDEAACGNGALNMSRRLSAIQPPNQAISIEYSGRALRTVDREKSRFRQSRCVIEERRAPKSRCITQASTHWCASNWSISLALCVGHLSKKHTGVDQAL